MSVSSNADQDDLFSAHDFDIHIDLPTNSNGKFVSNYTHVFFLTNTTPRCIKYDNSKAIENNKR